MTYATMMIHLDVGSGNEAVLRIAADLSARFRPKVIGIAACQPMQVIASDGYMLGDMVGMDLAEIARETSEAETSFRAALHGQAIDLEWRSVTAREALADCLVREVRAADLLVTGPDVGWSAFDSSRRVVVSNVVLKAGRPVLIVPSRSDGLDVGVVVVAWKDTREARRAIADAIPLLKQADRVVVVEIASRHDVAAAHGRLDDVSAWLGRHGVAAESLAATSIGDDAAQLQAIVKEKQAGVMVAGAYGHNRMREWVLGGVTRELLMYPGCCAFVSH